MAFQKLDTAPLGADSQRIQRLIREQLPRLIEDGTAGRYGAFGLGIGRKCAGGPVALRFYVTCKQALDQLPPARRIPSTVTIPDEAGTGLEVPTDVIERGLPAVAMADPESTLRPVPGGVSISIPGSGGNGTLGAWVLDNTDETVVALTNRHVAGGLPGAPVIQPGSNDGGSLPGDRIGFVKRAISFIPLPPNPTPTDCNFVDAAIIGADDPDLIDLTVNDLGPGIYESGTAAIGDSVQKSGQTTGYTTGVVVDEDFNFSLPVPFSPGNFQTVGFCDCYIIDEAPGTPLPGFLSDGDSGAVLFGFAADPEAVIHPALGLLFASTGGGGAYACKIQYVFNLLDLDVLCASGYPAYLEGVAEGAPDPGLAAEAHFAGNERCNRSATRASAGLARDMEQRLLSSATGEAIVDLVRRHRHPILARLIRKGDFRRAVTAALKPALRGARSTDDVFAYELDKGDFDRIEVVEKILEREGLGEIAREVGAMRKRVRRSKAKTLGGRIGIRD